MFLCLSISKYIVSDDDLMEFGYVLSVFIFLFFSFLICYYSIFDFFSFLDVLIFGWWMMEFIGKVKLIEEDDSC